MKLRILTIMIILFSINCITQDNIQLFKNEDIKITFKKIDNQHGYITEETNSMYGLTLFRYVIDGQDFIMTELDTIILLDSIIFYDSYKYKKDSLMISLRFRVTESPNYELSSNHLYYIINDTLKYDGTKMYKNDDFHRALIPSFKPPYNLKIEDGDKIIGPFVINSNKDLKIKLVVLTSAYAFQCDLKELIPKEINYNGKKMNLKCIFL